MSNVFHSPMQSFEATPAELAAERINVKKAQKPFRDRLSANSYDINRGTFGTEWMIHGVSYLSVDSNLNPIRWTIARKARHPKRWVRFLIGRLFGENGSFTILDMA